MKKKNYFEPVMKLHELKTGRIMTVSGEHQTNNTPSSESKNGDYYYEKEKLFRASYEAS